MNNIINLPDGKRKQNNGKRPAHVKWDGKTIALGTFPAEEAEIVSTRAKALTKQWRSKMHPKPSVEWVKHALEQENVRVVNDRPGRQKLPKSEEPGKDSEDRKHIIIDDNNLDGGIRNSCDDEEKGGGGYKKLKTSQTGKNFSIDAMENATLAKKYPLREQDVDSTLAMLKIHHSNLVNEIEETVVLMNFYQEQQLQRLQKREQEGEQQQIKQRQTHLNSSEVVQAPNTSQIFSDQNVEYKSGICNQKKRGSFNNYSIL